MIDQCLCDDAVKSQIESRTVQFNDDLLNDHQYVLRWCSGKDLFASLTPEHLHNTGVEIPQTLCNILRDWVRDHPEEFIGYLPEFIALKQQMTGFPPLQPQIAV